MGPIRGVLTQGFAGDVVDDVRDFSCQDWRRSFASGSGAISLFVHHSFPRMLTGNA